MSRCAHCGADAGRGATSCPACGKPPGGRPGRTSSSSTLKLLLVVAGILLLIGIAIIAAVAVPPLLQAMQRSKQLRTMADIRSVATAIEAYEVDHDEYPRVAAFAELGPLLTPTYIKELPESDGWGAPIRYECRSSSGIDPSAPCDGYLLSSGGKDGIFETDGEIPSFPRETHRYECDILYANGQFVQYPRR